MPIRDIAAMNRSLDNDYGTSAGPGAPATHLLCLWVGDPSEGGTEQTGPGYTRATIAPGDWAAAADGYKTLTDPAGVGTPTDEWVDDSDYWALLDGADDTIMWDYAPLAEPLQVTAAGGTPVEVLPMIYYNDAVTEPE